MTKAMKNSDELSLIATFTVRSLLKGLSTVEFQSALLALSQIEDYEGKLMRGFEVFGSDEDTDPELPESSPRTFVELFTLPPEEAKRHFYSPSAFEQFVTTLDPRQ